MKDLEIVMRPSLQTDRFHEQAAIVTGAGSGIGRATAKLLCRQGASVLLVDLNRGAVESVASEIHAEGGLASFTVADVSLEAEAKRTTEQAAGQWKGIQLLVNNAASFVQKGVEATVEEWYKPWETNVLGAALFSRFAYPLMRAAGGGAIVNVASVSGMIGEANYVTYNSSKAALLILTQCLAVELGAYNIRVNAVSPGVTITPALLAAVKRDGLSYEEFEKTWPERQCLRRLCQPEDVAHAISFLLSQEASCITGTNLVVDVGFMAKK